MQVQPVDLVMGMAASSTTSRVVGIITMLEAGGREGGSQSITMLWRGVTINNTLTDRTHCLTPLRTCARGVISTLEAGGRELELRMIDKVMFAGVEGTQLLIFS